MKTTIKDSEMNTTLDQAVMTRLFGGHTIMKSLWNLTCSVCQHATASLGNCFRSGNILKKTRKRRRRSKRSGTHYYRRNITDQSTLKTEKSTPTKSSSPSGFAGFSYQKNFNRI